ncbi:MAG: hypothetical protein KGI08_08185 [Thaumarchaeota archaeon]|nr:hypothetical protein [Nitrososphaerota archaeon]
MAFQIDMTVIFRHKLIGEVEDHYIVISVFIMFILFIALNDAYIGKNNCHVLEPAEICIDKGVADRSQVVNNPEYAFIPAKLSIYHLDEYREKPQFGHYHYECVPNTNQCTYHVDSFNALQPPFGTVAHLADFMATSCPKVGSFNAGSSCFGVPDYTMVILIWASFTLLPYYGIKHTILYLRK